MSFDEQRWKAEQEAARFAAMLAAEQPGGSMAVERGCTCSTEQPSAQHGIYEAEKDCPVHGLDRVKELREASSLRSERKALVFPIMYGYMPRLTEDEHVEIRRRAAEFINGERNDPPTIEEIIDER